MPSTKAGKAAAADARSEAGLVVAAFGRHHDVELASGLRLRCVTRGKKRDVAAGDRVTVLLQGADQGVIESIAPRTSLLYRSDEARTKVFAANVSRVFIVVATEPSFSDELIGRTWVAARAQGVDLVIILNKVDRTERLDEARRRLQPYAQLGLPVVEACAKHRPEEAARLLRPLLANQTSIVIGQSGMGKSTLVNLLAPQALAATQEHSESLDAGKHTTTATHLYRLDAHSSLIDSPGFQSFGLSHLTPGEIERGFPEFDDAKMLCRFYNCTHLHEPGCGVLAARDAGRILAFRHQLYATLMAEIFGAR
jgi:ribosome biogenesis GTPase